MNGEELDDIDGIIFMHNKTKKMVNKQIEQIENKKETENYCIVDIQDLINIGWPQNSIQYFMSNKWHAASFREAILKKLIPTKKFRIIIYKMPKRETIIEKEIIGWAKAASFAKETILSFAFHLKHEAFFKDENFLIAVLERELVSGTAICSLYYYDINGNNIDENDIVFSSGKNEPLTYEAIKQISDRIAERKDEEEKRKEYEQKRKEGLKKYQNNKRALAKLSSFEKRITKYYDKLEKMEISSGVYFISFDGTTIKIGKGDEILVRLKTFQKLNLIWFCKLLAYCPCSDISKKEAFYHRKFNKFSKYNNSFMSTELFSFNKTVKKMINQDEEIIKLEKFE